MFKANIKKLLEINALIFIYFLTFFENIDAKSIYDPTKPPGIHKKIKSITTQFTPKWRLNSTLISNNRKSATINGELLHQGDFINGAVLVDIQSLSVTLRKNKIKFKIYMFERIKLKK